MHEDHSQLLGGISPAEFLNTYWQKKPCLIRQALPGFPGVMNRQELIRMASDERVESRIVLEQDGEYPWQVLHGPVDEAIIAELPASHWTLLVQGVNFFDARAAGLLQRFSFLPNWRIDDLMISYASEHGSVGPHVDSYDVFLLQALGRRCWRISTRNYTQADLLPGADLAIIERFVTEQEWELEPGDMLYLPPGIAHHGIALEECMTYSIGFRAPTQHELLTRYLEDRYDPGGDVQYADPGLEVPRYRGEVPRHSLERISKIMRSALADSNDIENWFGSYITSLPEQFIRDNPPVQVDEDGFRKILSGGGSMQLHFACRAAFYQSGGGFHLFVNGCDYLLPVSCKELVIGITDFDAIDSLEMVRTAPEDWIHVLHDLYNKGILINC